MSADGANTVFSSDIVNGEVKSADIGDNPVWCFVRSGASTGVLRSLPSEQVP